jgi:hypothetical protein
VAEMQDIETSICQDQVEAGGPHLLAT